MFGVMEKNRTKDLSTLKDMDTAVSHPLIFSEYCWSVAYTHRKMLHKRNDVLSSAYVRNETMGSKGY